MAVSVLFAAGTVLVMVLETVQSRHTTLREDDRTAALAGWLLAGVFVAFAGGEERSILTEVECRQSKAAGL